jgi:hypothetical protein
MRMHMHNMHKKFESANRFKNKTREHPKLDCIFMNEYFKMIVSSNGWKTTAIPVCYAYFYATDVLVLCIKWYYSSLG